MNTIRIEIMAGRTEHSEEYGPEFHVGAAQRVEYTQAEPIEKLGKGKLWKTLLCLFSRGLARIDQILERKHLEIPICEACGEPIRKGMWKGFHSDCYNICLRWKEWQKYLQST